MATIKPTLGRVVWFKPSKYDGVIAPGNDGKCAALVTFVHGDKMVNLSIFDANGNHHARTSVPLLQDGDDRWPDGFYCEWMPYQLGQAAKTECLQQVADAARKGFSDATVGK